MNIILYLIYICQLITLKTVYTVCVHEVYTSPKFTYAGLAMTILVFFGFLRM